MRPTYQSVSIFMYLYLIHMFNNPFTALLTGAVVGFIAVVPLQMLTNNWSTSLCQARDGHQLITTKNFFGTLKSCVDNRYL